MFLFGTIEEFISLKVELAACRKAAAAKNRLRLLYILLIAPAVISQTDGALSHLGVVSREAGFILVLYVCVTFSRYWLFKQTV